MHQVAKSASKVGKSGSRWAHLAPSGLTFDAGWAMFGLHSYTFAQFYFFCVFVQYSYFLTLFA